MELNFEVLMMQKYPFRLLTNEIAPFISTDTDTILYLLYEHDDICKQSYVHFDPYFHIWCNNRARCTRPRIQINLDP